ncbi:MAG: sugar phosphate isomerase/epimerase [Verrucomicrobiota bacterium]
MNDSAFEHPLALSTCWNSRRFQDGEELLEHAAEQGFAAVELSHAIRYSLWPGILRGVENKVVRISSLHNFCPVPMGVLQPSPNCYLFSDERPETREAAVKHTVETLRHAAELGARAVVLHLGYAGPKGTSQRLEKFYEQGGPYCRGFVKAKVKAVTERREVAAGVWERIQSCLDQIVPAAQELGVRLGFENRENYAEYPDDDAEMDRALAAYPGETVGYWHDFGHAARKDFFGFHDHEATLRRLAPRLIGCHLHDCEPPTGDHRPLGTGKIDFPSLVSILPRQTIPVLELSPRVRSRDVRQSLDRWNSYASTLA